MSTLLYVRALHEECVPKKAIAHRLGVDVRTVRRYIRCIARGAQEPLRAAVPRKLDRFLDDIEAKVMQGLSAVQIFQDLSATADFQVAGASYETVKRMVRTLR